MKKCPTCDREFDDAMRFCQTDGTALVDAPPPVDPYKTMVARPEDIASAIPQSGASSGAPGDSGSSISDSGTDEEVLDLPADDPKKTMYASEEEIRSAMAEVDEPVVDLPPSSSEPQPPEFIAGENKPVSPLAAVQEEADRLSVDSSKTSPPIPSPFGGAPGGPSSVSGPQEGRYDVPEAQESPRFAQPEPPSPGFNPFNESASATEDSRMAEADWTPTPAAQQDQGRHEENMQNPQYQPGSGLPAAGGQNKTLAIVSLVAGILGLTLCCGWFLPSLLGLILGFMARSKANQNPAEYGGGGLATGGIITGALGLVGGVVVWILYVFYFAAIMASMPR
ncbi:MAG TPA: DUF4190 domain-containing protein [Pyrinomonadaceae bacterium]